MKRTAAITLLVTGTLLFGTMPSAYAQKQNVKEAERIAKSKDAKFDDARMLIKSALENAETKDDAKTWYVAGFVEENNFTQENVKALDGQPQDRKTMNNALLDMFGYYQEAYQRDQQPNEKGKIRPQYDKKILKAYEENLLYFINAGGYFMEVKEFDKATKAFEAFRAIKHHPAFAGKPIAQADSNSMMVDFFEVVSAYQAGKKEDAIKLAESIKNVPYRQNDLMQILSQTYIETADTVGYVRTMEEGMKLFPEEPYYSVNLTNTYIQQGKTEEAIALLEKTIAQSPNNAQLYDVMGKLYEAIDEEKAIEYFKKALEVDPTFKESVYNLGRVYYNMGARIKSGEKVDAASDAKAKEYFKLALPLMEQAYKNDPDGSWYILGNVYYNLKMTDKYEQIQKAHNTNK